MLRMKLLTHLISTPITLSHICTFLIHNRVAFQSIFTNLLFPQTTVPVKVQLMNKATSTISTSRII
uniref:Uncharacterized protein n=1 Tax=Wuchereria bancrofti TaxID=6293 RepID=A0AAF5Q7W5_WUCBA